MATTIFEEMIEKSIELTPEERQKLIAFLQEQDEPITQNPPNGAQKSVSPNVVWLKQHRQEFAGKYVALADGKLVGQGKNFREAANEAKANGKLKAHITYVFPPDSEPFGGW